NDEVLWRSAGKVGIGRGGSPAFPALSGNLFFFALWARVESSCGFFAFCLELLSVTELHQVISLFMAGDNHAGSKCTKAGFGPAVFRAHRNDFFLTLRFSTRPGKQREPTYLAWL